MNRTSSQPPHLHPDARGLRRFAGPVPVVPSERSREMLFMTSRRNLITRSDAALKDADHGARASGLIGLTQIRNATLHIDYAGVRFLVDPMLCKRGALPAGAEGPNGTAEDPLVDLPFAVEDIVNVDAVILTNLHPDHWDEVASASIARSMPLLVQNEADAARLRREGFEDVRIIKGDMPFGDISLTRIQSPPAGGHSAQTSPGMPSETSGVVIRHPAECTLYLVGDTVWNDPVRQALATYRPELIILNTGYAQMPGFGSVMMGAADVAEVAMAAPGATIVASHMEAFGHCPLMRDDLRDFAEWEGFSERLFIPLDGERILVGS